MNKFDTNKLKSIHNSVVIRNTLYEREQIWENKCRNKSVNFWISMNYYIIKNNLFNNGGTYSYLFMLPWRWLSKRFLLKQPEVCEPVLSRIRRFGSLPLITRCLISWKIPSVLPWSYEGSATATDNKRI